MASRPEDSASETQNISNPRIASQIFDEGFAYPETISDAYQQILHVADDPSSIERWSEQFEGLEIDYRAVGDELAPRDNYGSGEAVTLYDEFNSEDVLVVLTGQDGEELPPFSELGAQELEEQGNWWDNLMDQGADYLMDRWSYRGAPRIPLEAEVGKVEIDELGNMTYVTDQK